MSAQCLAWCPLRASLKIGPCPQSTVWGRAVESISEPVRACARGFWEALREGKSRLRGSEEERQRSELLGAVCRADTNRTPNAPEATHGFWNSRRAGPASLPPTQPPGLGKQNTHTGRHAAAVFVPGSASSPSCSRPEPSAFGLLTPSALLGGGVGPGLAMMSHLPSLRTKFSNENLCYGLKF